MKDSSPRTPAFIPIKLAFLTLGISLVAISYYVRSNYFTLKIEAEKAVLFQPTDSLIGKTNRELNIVSTSDLFASLNQLEKEGKSTVIVIEFHEDLEEPEIRKLASRVLKTEHSGYQGLFLNPSFPPVIELWCQPGTEDDWKNRFENESRKMKIEIVKIAERNDYYRE